MNRHSESNFLLSDTGLLKSEAQSNVDQWTREIEATGNGWQFTPGRDCGIHFMRQVEKRIRCGHEPRAAMLELIDDPNFEDPIYLLVEVFNDRIFRAANVVMYNLSWHFYDIYVDICNERIPD